MPEREKPCNPRAPIAFPRLTPGALTSGSHVRNIAAMRHLLFAGCALLAAACAQAQSPSQIAPSQSATDVRVEALLKAAPIADGHNDWPYALRMAYGVDGAKTANLDEPVRITSPGGETSVGHTSVPWIRKGHLGYQLWSVYVSASLSPEEAVKQTFEQIGVARSFAERRPDVFATVVTAADAEKAVKAGKVAGILAIEGANQVGDDIETLRKAHDLGVRSLTLAHSRNTRLFDSATDTPRHNGIAAEAPAFIAEMNRLGILVDLSHVSPAVMNQVLDVTKAPVIFSHSSAKAIANVPRNVPDDVLRRMPANGGIVMVSFVPQFTSQARADWDARRSEVAKAAGADPAAALKAWEAQNPRPVVTLAQVADHVEHVARVAGHDHVGIGGDFDGVPDLPVGLESVATYPALIAELARRGWSDANLKKLTSGNFLHVLRANEAVAASLSKKG